MVNNKGILIKIKMNIKKHQEDSSENNGYLRKI